MSFPRHRVAFAPRAQQDYDDILLYGLQTWGEIQMVSYQDDLDRALEELGAFPEIGRRRPDYFFGCRTHPVRSHILFYEIDQDEIRIVRILHHTADVRLHLSE
jgi:toxin ParE1/3/4